MGMQLGVIGSRCGLTERGDRQPVGIRVQPAPRSSAPWSSPRTAPDSQRRHPPPRHGTRRDAHRRSAPTTPTPTSEPTTSHQTRTPPESPDPTPSCGRPAGTQACPLWSGSARTGALRGPRSIPDRKARTRQPEHRATARGPPPGRRPDTACSTWRSRPRSRRYRVVTRIMTTHRLARAPVCQTRGNSVETSSGDVLQRPSSSDSWAVVDRDVLADRPFRECVTGLVVGVGLARRTSLSLNAVLVSVLTRPWRISSSSAHRGTRKQFPSRITGRPAGSPASNAATSW